MNYFYAIGAALLFGVSVPAGKVLLGDLRPLELSALCYLGSGFGLLAWRLVSSGGEAPLERRDLPYVAGSVLAGGMLAPLLLFTGLAVTASSSASMLLNFELVFTALIAVLVFKEQGGWRLWTAAAFVTAGGFALSGTGGGPVEWRGAALLLGAAFFWGVDNNLTTRVSVKDPVTLGLIKGLAGGIINAALAYKAYGSLPPAGPAICALGMGAFSYGASLVLFILAMRGLGASRAGAFFGSYPFIGAFLGVVVLGEPVTQGLLWAGAFMLAAFALLGLERHAHEHRHEALDHDHRHDHNDGHHGHVHKVPPAGPHAHSHLHSPEIHAHPHAPDAHHRHEH